MASARKKNSGFGILPGSKGVAVISKTKGSSEDSAHCLKCIFREHKETDEHKEKETEECSDQKAPSFSNMTSLESDLDKVLEDVLETNKEKIETCAHEHSCDCGRHGPEKTMFDMKGNSGTVVIEPDRVGVSSPINFSTIRANTCVFKGRWCYELMLGSMGVMQLGWCCLHCKFTQEDGVGDTEDSYSYDGNRVRKWNSKTPCKYGQMWLTGDVITCCMDCDEGTVSFYRNGEPLGEAYNTVKLGPGKAYFPAVSLSKNEQLRANFGGTPLRYPVAGYRPVQAAPLPDLLQAQRLFGYLENVIMYMTHGEAGNSGGGQVVDPLSAACTLTAPSVNPQVSIMLIASHIMHKLAPLLTNEYVVSVCVVSLLRRLCERAAWREPLGSPALLSFLHLLTAFCQEHELKACLEHLAVCLVSAYRYALVDPAFSQQFEYLTLILAVLRHDRTRKYMLKHVLFDKVKLPMLMHIKPPDDSGLARLTPDVWWQTQDGGDGPVLSPEEQERKAAYMASCESVRAKIVELEAIQVEMVRLLLSTNDNAKGVSSRFIFLHKFREFLKDNSTTPSRVHFGQLCPLPACLSFFHRLIRAVRGYWDEYHAAHPGQALPSADAFVPGCKFYDDNINYFDQPRLGGLSSHLKKTYKDEVYQAQLTAAGLTGHRLAQHRALLVKHSAFVEAQKRVHEDQALGEDMASAHSLVELLDSIVLLYTTAAHTQLSKMCTLRDNIRDYANALEETKKKLDRCPPEQTEVREELERACQVFLDKTMEQGRQMAWVIANIYTKEKQSDVAWVLRVSLTTVEKSAEKLGPLFTFMPSFYVDAIITSYNALKGYFHPTVPYTLIDDMEENIYRVALFLSNHISDSRVVNAETRESIIQALACFVCYPLSLSKLERLPQANQDKVLRFLLAPYEERSWAQTNWILVRLWKGCGFGFRYQHLPNLLPVKNQQQEISSASTQPPQPSHVLQRRMAELLLGDRNLATKLFDTVLNQLNWAWSEFIEMLQGLQQIAARPMQAYIDARQLKICATCFDIAVGLLRTLELIVALVPQLVTDGQHSAELLLARLCQSISQVLNRVTAQSNTFDTLVAARIPGMDTVDHFPVLTAVVGVLVRLVGTTPGPQLERVEGTTPGPQQERLEGTTPGPQQERVEGTTPGPQQERVEGAAPGLQQEQEEGATPGPQQELTIAALLAEPSFELSCLDFILGGGAGAGAGAGAGGVAAKGGAGSRAEGGTGGSEAAVAPPPGRKVFSLHNFEDVSQAELTSLRSLLSLLRAQQSKESEQVAALDDDAICDICYARPKGVRFRPCGHQSCKACIAHHLMNKKECFFCKAAIQAVVDTASGLPIGLPSLV